MFLVWPLLAAGESPAEPWLPGAGGSPAGRESPSLLGEMLLAQSDPAFEPGDLDPITDGPLDMPPSNPEEGQAQEPEQAGEQPPESDAQSAQQEPAPEGQLGQPPADEEPPLVPVEDTGEETGGEDAAPPDGETMPAEPAAVQPAAPATMTPEEPAAAPMTQPLPVAPTPVTAAPPPPQSAEKDQPLFDEPQQVRIAVLNGSGKPGRAGMISMLLNKFRSRDLQKKLGKDIIVVNYSNLATRMKKRKSIIYYRPGFMRAALLVADAMPGRQSVEPMPPGYEEKIGIDLEILVGGEAW